jgi:hypothetical protein
VNDDSSDSNKNLALDKGVNKWYKGCMINIQHRWKELQTLIEASNIGFSREAIAAVDEYIQKLDREAGPGLNVGRILRFSAADGYALYLVTDIQPSVVQTKHLNYADGYSSPAVNKDGLVFRDVAEKIIAFTDALNDMFGAPSTKTKKKCCGGDCGCHPQ